MRNIAIILFKYGDLVFGKVLYTHPNLIGHLYFNHAYDGSLYTLESSLNPYMGHRVLDIWGCSPEYNDTVIYQAFESNEKALEAFKAFKSLIDAVNALTLEDLV